MYYTLEEISVLIETNKYTLNTQIHSVLELLQNDVSSYAIVNEERPVKKYSDRIPEQRNRYKKIVAKSRKPLTSTHLGTNFL
jgi:uncharacterized membrane protein YgaE (UPF0421/DUF939 family)